MTSLVLYPRGFIGYDIGLEPKTRGPGTAGLLNSLRINKPIVIKDKTFVSNTDVENIWRQYKNGDKFLSSFDFRKKIILVALEAFGTKSFYDWCVLQTQNPYITDMQKRFINDTFNYINGGKRSVTISSWLKLIDVKDETSSTGDPVEIKMEEFFGTNKPIQFRTDYKLNNIICFWLRKKGGFEDLVGTMHIFFGDKDIH